MTVFTENLRVQNAKNFKDMLSITKSNNRTYFCFGRSYPWANDSSPEMANTAPLDIIGAWKDIIGAKLITGSEISHVIPRYNWTPGTSYNAYMDDKNNEGNFYVINSENNVYKCLGNNSSSVSTIEPLQILTTNPVQEDDGYIWKFMYTASDSDLLKYSTDSFIPVKTLELDDSSLQWQVQSSAQKGTIDSIIILNSGSGYSNANNITVSIHGDGSEASAMATINSVSNTVSSIIMTNIGKNYTYANVSITGGTGAVLKAVIAPPGGHGKDPLTELNGKYLMINPRLQYSEEDYFPTTNDFRQISLILNPTLWNSNTAANNVLYSQYTEAVVDSTITNFEDDEVVFQGPSQNNATFIGKVLFWDSSNSKIYITSSTGIITSDTLYGATTGTTKYVRSINYPDLEPFSGKVLYINNLEPIMRAVDQTESFQIALKF